MVGLRDCVNELIDLQMDEYCPESAIREKQAELNNLYDAFSAKYGLLNDRANRLAFSDDSSYYLLCSLEVLDDDGKLKRKADMFHKRTIKQQTRVETVDTASEALAVCIGEKACVNLGFMASLMGGSDKIPQIVEDLKGVIYKDPTTGAFDLEDGGTNWSKGWQMQTLAAHPLPVEGFIGMEIRGDKLTDKENAGAALLDACKEVKSKDPVQIGSYRGFTMSVAFDSFQQEYTLTLRGQMTHRVELGTDARGNLVRIENALEKMPERLRNVQDQLENLYNQQAAAKAEVGKPFPQERELAEKTARLIELDMELNLDSKGQAQPEQAIAKSARPSVLDKLKAPPVRGTPDKPHKKEMEVR